MSGAAARTGNLRGKMRKILYKKEIGCLYEKQTRKKTMGQKYTIYRKRIDASIEMRIP